MVNEIRTPRSKEPEQTLEDEFKDLHLNLAVLEVLAHASMYNAIIDKYVESLELGKNGSAFIQGKYVGVRRNFDRNHPTNWDRPPKEGDGAWHIRIELIDPDGEKFKKTFQSIPVSRKLFAKENPSEIIDLDHFYDS
ncbi:hypothetical protein Tco_0677771 [Tanacetum coccineum]|uniref:rRNA N-glycosidase n=1 Tax=Tanacetum coccineum TaxID=301880 RepID=A0ABQ4XEG2_9ASTR